MMNTALPESSFRSQGTPRMGYINILMKTKRGKGFWHISTSCKKPFPSPALSRDTSSSSHCRDSQGKPPGRWCKNHPAGFYGLQGRQKVMVMGTKGPSSCLEGKHCDSYRTNGVPSVRGPETPSHKASMTFHVLYRAFPMRKRISLLVLCRAGIFWMSQCKFY